MLQPNDPPSTEKIRFTCPNCEAKVAAPPTYAGKKMRCPKCSNPVAVPLPPVAGANLTLPELPDEGLLLKNEWLVFRCPACSVNTKVYRSNFNKLVACGACKYEFSVGVD
jgi:uncharacterized paraquat-inducible protein A